MAGRGCVCMRGVAGTGWRAMVVVFIYSHTQSISVIKRCEGFQRSEVDRHRVQGPIGRAIIISQVSTVTNMSIPLQADLSSVVEKGAMSRRDIANFKGQPTATRAGIFGRGGGTVRKKNAVHEEARISEKKRERKGKTDLFTRTFVFEDVKRYEKLTLFFGSSDLNAFFSKIPSPSHLFSRLRDI